MLSLNQRRPRSIFSSKSYLRQVIGCLLVFFLISAVSISTAGAQSNQTATVIYNGDNGNHGDITFHLSYHFKSNIVYYKVTQITVEQSYKMKGEEPALFKEVMRQGIWSNSKYLKNLTGTITAEVHFGLTKLKTSTARISSSIYGVGQNNYTTFTPPNGADKIVHEYSTQHNRNLYTDNCNLFRIKVSNLSMYELDNVIKSLRDKLKSDKRESQRVFESKITQASLNGNLGKFDQAESLLNEARALIKGNSERQRKYDQTKAAINRQKEAAAKKMAQLKQQAAQKATATKQAAIQQQKAAQNQTNSASLKKTGQQQPSSYAGHAQAAKAAAAQRENSATSAKTRYQNVASSKMQAQYEAQLARKKQAAERLQAQRDKAEAMRRRVAQMKAQLEETNRKAARIDAAKDQFLAGLTSSSSDPNQIMNAAKPLVREFAKQGNFGAAYGTAGVALAGSIFKMASANKKRKEAQRAAEEQRRRIQEQQAAERKRIAAEKERLRKRAFALLMSGRRTILKTFSQSDPIPLSTTPIEDKVIYYFLYAIDKNSFDSKKQTTVYVSNVFAIEKYRDGTWPYQSKIAQEITNLTPYKEQLQGYYTDLDQALQMREEFVGSLQASEGIKISKIAYKDQSLAQETGDLAAGSDALTNEQADGLGVSLGRVIKPSKDGKKKAVTAPVNSSKAKQQAQTKSSALGLRLGPAPVKKSSPKAATKKAAAKGANNAAKATEVKKDGAKKTGGLGIPIK